MRRFAIATLVIALVAPVAAQPVATDTACAACSRGDAVIDQFSLQPLRDLAGELVKLELSEPLTEAQYARVVALRQRAPVLVRLGAVDEADFVVIAAALCRADLGTCTEATARALRCAADLCEVALPKPPGDGDVLVVPEYCQPSTEPKRSAPFGLGFSWGTGYHRSRYPHDGRAWSFGIEARLRLTNRFSTVARIDRIAGRDAATDEDGNGDDDVWTGSITRIAALAGPSIILARGEFEREPRFLRLDLLGGYISTRSQTGESGPAAGADLAYQLSVFRVGVRFIHGFGDASEATTLLAHVGVVGGALPVRERSGNCDARGRPISHDRRRSTRLAIGFDTPLVGYGLTSELGYLTPGVGAELLWTIVPKLDVLVRGDLLLFPGDDRERTIHQAALAGIRIDHGRRKRYSETTGFFTTVMSGYSHAAGIMPRKTGSGPVGDLSLGWGMQSGEAAAYFRLHTRFGISRDNFDYRAIFLSGGFEIRFDPRRWRARP